MERKKERRKERKKKKKKRERGKEEGSGSESFNHSLNNVRASVKRVRFVPSTNLYTQGWNKHELELERGCTRSRTDTPRGRLTRARKEGRKECCGLVVGRARTETDKIDSVVGNRNCREMNR